MITKYYPKLWASSNGENPIIDGVLTNHAENWIDCFSGLTKKIIKSTYEKLFIDYPTFPPTPMEFKNLCVSDDFDDVLDAIMCRLQDGDSYEWTNQLAFTFWTKYSFDLRNMKNYEVPKLIKQNLRMFDKLSLVSLPDYKALALTSDLKPKHDPTLRDRIIFQKNMSNSINRVNPKLWLNPKSTKTPPKKMLDIFSKTGTMKLMQKFKAGEDMDKFLTKEGVL